MKKDSLAVYERPEAEEVKLVISSNVLSNTETPECPDNEECVFETGSNRYREL